MATVTLRPTNGLQATGIGSWGIVSATENNILNAGYGYHTGVIFSMSDLRYVKITSITLRVRMEASSPQVPGQLFTEAFWYTNITALNNDTYEAKAGSRVLAFVKRGISGAAQYVDFDITKQSDLFQSYPANIALPLLMYPDADWTGNPGIFRVHLYQCQLIIEYEEWNVPAPTNFTPSSGKFNPGEPRTYTWKYNPSSSPNDVQVGSNLQYRTSATENGLLTATWHEIVINNKNNNYTFPANFFPQNIYIQLRVMSRSSVGNSPFSSEYNFSTYGVSPPTTLSPDETNRNPASAITLTWKYVKSDFSNDVQISSILQYREKGASSWGVITKNDNLNTHIFPVGLFSDGKVIEWQVRTVSNVGTSDWSYIASFTLASTPPSAPHPDFPVNDVVSPSAGVLLAWIYRSDYDIFPTRFDVEYRIDSGAWRERNLFSVGDLPASINTLISAEEFGEIQRTVEWRVRAYGEFGDVGPWSSYAIFWTFGLPPAPTVVNVTNSNLPIINFNALIIMAWELEILQDNNVIYATGSQPYTGLLQHKMTDFIPNGNYVARIRVVNEFGVYSAWGALAFTINVVPPAAMRLDIAFNTKHFIRLTLSETQEENENPVVATYIYRAEFGTTQYTRIAQITGNIYDDYTAAPNKKYLYFARSVDINDSFADSNIDVGGIRFIETIIAEYDNPDKMLLLAFNLDAKPAKIETFNVEKTVIVLVGRQFPVFETGANRGRTLSYTFYCTPEETARLGILAESGKTLILRDRRFGAIYGTIGDVLNIQPELDGYIVSFSFTQTDFNPEVPLW